MLGIHYFFDLGWPFSHGYLVNTPFKILIREQLFEVTSLIPQFE